MPDIIMSKPDTQSLISKDDPEVFSPKVISPSHKLTKYLEEEQLPESLLKSSSKAFSKDKYRAIMISHDFDPVTQVKELVAIAKMPIEKMYAVDKKGNASINPKLLQCKIDANKVLQRLAATDRTSVDIDVPDGVDQVRLSFGT